jgi:hypothetical protein
MIYARDEPDSNGWEYFATFGLKGEWYWQACTHDGEERGPFYGPFPSEAAAYRAGNMNSAHDPDPEETEE